MGEPKLTGARAVAGFVALALMLLPFADLEVSGHKPWAELARFGSGLLSPNFTAVGPIARALAMTVAFAVAGVAAGGAVGLALAPFYHLGPVRAACVLMRSIHELFWALVLLQVTGLSVATGVLAIALPYAGIFAKVFAETLEEADQRPSRLLPASVDPLSRFLYTRAPLSLPAMRTYTLYRLECGLRSSAVLGFIGLPTLGYELDTVFRAGQYDTVGAILALYVTTIATIRLWMRRVVAPLWLAASIALLSAVSTPPMGQGALWRFLTEDIVPAPLRAGYGPERLPQTLDWLHEILWVAVLPGIGATLVVAQLALVLTGLVAFLCAPFVVSRVTGPIGAIAGHLALVVGRSLPEYLLAYVFLQILGPSMLPAILALALHNGAIIAFLVGLHGDALCGRLRADAARGIDFWCWELVPRLFGPFLALCLYRWEIIVRESAIVGILGVMTLGFYVDSAIAELRLDRAALMLLATALLTGAIDAASRAIRARIGGGEFGGIGRVERA